MGELMLAAPVAGLAEKGRITADDVRLLRGEVFRDGVVTRAEAESLIALHSSCTDRCADWQRLLRRGVDRLPRPPGEALRLHLEDYELPFAA